MYRGSFSPVRDVFIAALTANDVMSESVVTSAHRASLQTMAVAFRGPDADTEVIKGHGSPKRVATAFVTLFNECLTKELLPLKVSVSMELRRALQNSIVAGLNELNANIAAEGTVDPTDVEPEA